VTWLAGVAPDASLTDLVALRPGLRPRVKDLLTELWVGGAVPVRVLELCRLRAATLLRCSSELASRTPAAAIDEDLVAALPRWPDDPRFDATDRACLEFAEQFVIDPHGVTDDQVGAVRVALGDDGAVALTVGLALFEGFARAQQTLGVTSPDHGEVWR
jgi:alkylhydroperoxidase family enzyme